MKIETEAVEALIKSVTGLTSKVAVATMPRDSAGNLVKTPYVIVWPTDGQDSAERADLRAVSRNPKFTLHVVGSSYGNCQSVTELIKAKFVVRGVGVKLAIAGWNPHPVRWSMPASTQVDDSVQPPLVFNIVELAFQSDPTT